jgi:hypothetical protein
MADDIDYILSVLSLGRDAMRSDTSRTRLDDDISLRTRAARRRVFAAMLIAMATTLAATHVVGQGAVPCTAIEDDVQRLACYDRALRGSPPAPAVAAPAPAVAAPAAAIAAPAAAPQPERAAAAPAPPAAASTSGGQEIIPIVVVATRALPGRETTFTTEDGASYVQTDSQRLDSLPRTPFAAEIKRGAVGSYFLVPQDRRAIRVRPVR